jgi:hypothetical protein
LIEKRDENCEISWLFYTPNLKPAAARTENTPALVFDGVVARPQIPPMLFEVEYRAVTKH